MAAKAQTWLRKSKHGCANPNMVAQIQTRSRKSNYGQKNLAWATQGQISPQKPNLSAQFGFGIRSHVWAFAAIILKLCLQGIYYVRKVCDMSVLHTIVFHT